MQNVRVGIREFRENLSDYLLASKPVTITRHGEPIGFFVPVRRRPTKAEIEAFRESGRKVQEMLNAAGITEDDVIADLEEMDRQRKAKS
jgi:prevent-host-death family protein